MTITTTKRPLLDVGRVIQNAVVFNFKNGSDARMNSDSLPIAISNLFELLHSREGLLLLKLYALPSLYRQANFARVGIYENDIAALLQRYSPKTELLFKELEKHLDKGDLDSVREIVSEIEQRIVRFSKRSGE